MGAVKRQNAELALFAPLAVEYCALPCPAKGLQSGSPARDPPRPHQESAMGDLSHGTPLSATPPEDRLDSWKEIAAYLKRDVTTVQRWEKREGMPVHRHQHDRMGSVYAFSSEIDAWVQSRRLRLEEEEKERQAETRVDAEGDNVPGGTLPATHWLVLGGVALLAVLAVTYFMTRSRASGAAQPKITSLAVLPLKNLSGDPTQEYLADGMTEALIGRLSAIHDLRVISRTSAMHFKDTQLSVPEIAKTLHVDAIVEGSVIREGSRIRVTAQLIRGATDEHFWSETYDHELRDALTLESEVAQAIARKVEVTITGEEHERLTAVRSVSPEVYESYLKGEFTLDKSNTRADVEKSIGYYEDAIKKDPSFAPAYVGLAASYDVFGTILFGAPPGEIRPKVIAAARKALELDPELAYAHVLLGSMLRKEWQWADSEAEYRRALELSPGNSAAQAGFSEWLLCQGRLDEALVWAQRAREHDPLTISGSDIADVLFTAHRFDEAVRESRSVVAVRPDDAMLLWGFGFDLIADGKPEEAIPVLDKAVSLSNRSPGVIGVLIRAYAHAGRRKDALRLLEELKARQKKGYIPAAAFVNAYLGLDDKEMAFVWLEKAYQEKSNILQYLKVHPFFDPLRDDPRFVDLVRRVGLDQTR
jgi:TolB-like protein/Flp pilus assembly protein TadD